MKIKNKLLMRWTEHTSVYIMLLFFLMKTFLKKVSNTKFKSPLPPK